MNGHGKTKNVGIFQGEAFLGRPRLEPRPKLEAGAKVRTQASFPGCEWLTY